MRTVLALLVAGLPLAGPAHSSACAPPDEGPYTCCQSYLVYTEVGGQTVAVPDPRIRLYCS